MNTWLSDQKPLLSLVFNYMNIYDHQKWRNTSKRSVEYSDASIFPKKWREFVLEPDRFPRLVVCPDCNYISHIKKMFLCPSCMRIICGLHVVACGMCLFETCCQCAVVSDCDKCLCQPAYY